MFSPELREHAEELVGRYPAPRSALLPLLHLVQAQDGYISEEGLAECARLLELTRAEVGAVATFYTMYKRERVGKHHIGVCTNTLCGLLGGDAVWDSLVEATGAGHNQPSSDGEFFLERIECQAACTHAPVMTVDWEFMDDVTPSSAVEVIENLRRGETVHSTRGPAIRDFQATERTLAFPDDGLADAPSVDDKMLAGLRIAKERANQHGMTGGNA